MAAGYLPIRITSATNKDFVYWNSYAKSLPQGRDTGSKARGDRCSPIPRNSLRESTWMKHAVCDIYSDSDIRSLKMRKHSFCIRDLIVLSRVFLILNSSSGFHGWVCRPWITLSQSQHNYSVARKQFHIGISLFIIMILIRDSDVGFFPQKNDETEKKSKQYRQEWRSPNGQKPLKPKRIGTIERLLSFQFHSIVPAKVRTNRKLIWLHFFSLCLSQEWAELEADEMEWPCASF